MAASRAAAGWRRRIAFGTGLIVAVSFCLRSWADPDWRKPVLTDFEFFDDTGAEQDASFHKRFHRAVRTELEDVAGARALYEALLQERPETAYLYYKLGRLDAREQDLDSCIEKLRKAIELDPALRVAYNDLEQIHVFRREEQKLVELWELAIAGLKPDNTAYFLKLGSLHEKRDRLDEAIAVYERAVAEHPVLYQPWLELFRIQLDQGKTTEAYETYRNALEATGGHRELLVGVREAYGRAGDAEHVFELTQLLVERFPLVADFWYDGVAALLDRGKTEEAQATFKKSCAYVGREPGYLARIVRLYTAYGDPEVAVAALEFANRFDPDVPEVLVALALLYQFQGRMDEAQPLFDRLLESGQQSEALLLAVAEGCESQGDLEGFGQWAGRAMLAAPGSVEARFAMVRYLERTGKTKEARALLSEILDDVLEGSRPDPAPLAGIGRFYLGREEYDLAREIAGRGLESTRERPLVRQFYYISGVADYAQDRIPDAARKLGIASRNVGEMPPAHFFYGMANLRLGRSDEAVVALEKAVGVQPDDAFSRLKLGAALKQAGRNEEAERMLESAITVLTKQVELEPDSVTVRISLAAGFDAIGRSDEAIRVYKEAVALDAKSATALNNLAYTMAVQGVDLDEALELVTRALELEPDNGTFADTLGWIYYKQNKAKDALRELERAVELGPASGEILDHVGDVHLKLGDKTKAIEWWNKALERYPLHAAEIRSKVVEHGGTPSVEPTTEPSDE
ncbi:MAG: tetratricopeptide repeat protein [Verrucomicrobia bacterium]|nr:tetratricopeptide repeat protein [Verrucomicrobiota bacterium]